MSLWVKLQTNFFTHRKTMRLKAALGNDAFWIPLRLWAYAAENQQDGNFSDYSAEEIAVCIGYTGDASSMLQAVLKAGFIDPDKRIHDWGEHNGYHRIFHERAKKAAAVRYAKVQRKEADKKRGEETSSASSMLEARKPNGSPIKFVSELKAQISEATGEITRLRDFGTSADASRIKELCAKRKEWRRQLLEA